MELSADWVSGFVDGEGCFLVGIQKNPEMGTGYQVLPEFTVVQPEKDIQVLYALKRFFGSGVVRRNHTDRYAYRVREIKSLEKICDFFLKHPLKTKKNIDFRKFRRIVLMLKEGKHLSVPGIKEILDLAIQMNSPNREALERIKKELLAR